jgi:alkylated DNA repair dioxygenase AlkB
METMNPPSTPPQPRKSALAAEAPIDPQVPIRTARSFLAIGTLEREERVLLDRCAAYAAGGRLMVKPPVVVMGKPCRQQRNVGFFSNKSTGYRYSGKCMKAQPLGPEMGSLLALANRRYQAEFNGILVNHYLDGEDYIGAHSDDESALAPGAGVVAVSWGAERLFRIRDRGTKKIAMDVPMRTYQIIQMGGDFQSEFTHEVPRQKKVRGERMSFTFRRHDR